MDWFTYKKHLTIYKETDTHPRIKTEKPDLFFSVNFESTEIDYLDFLNGLVVAKKPKFILETGTNIGISTVALAFALKSNAEHGIKGHLYTIDKDSNVIAIAKERIEQVELKEYVSFIVQDSLEAIKHMSGGITFDVVYFDSTRIKRPDEFYALRDNGLLNKDCILAFHDTCQSTIKDNPGEKDIQNCYLTSLEEIERLCTGKISFNLSRGLTILQC